MDLITKKIQQLYTLNSSEFWPVGPETGQLLFETCKQVQAKKVLELGTSSGVSALYMLKFLATNAGKLMTIESNFKRFKLAIETFDQTKMKKHVLPIFDHAPECFEYLNLDNLDLVFTDCIKKQTLEMFLLLFPKLKPDGAFIVDNVLSHKEAMQPFVNYLKAHNIKYELFDFESGSIRIYKKLT